MPDLHGWITQQIDRVEARAKVATPGPWEGVVDRHQRGEVNASVWSDKLGYYITETITSGERHEADAHHIGEHNPATVLRRCEADRRILARHRLNPDAYWAEAAMCHGCGTEGEMDYPRTENLNDCPELLDLGYAHGLTDEILAGLDRPQEGERPEPTGPSLIPDGLAEAMYGNLLATFIGTRPIEPRPEVKALEILAPELKKIPGYIPTTNPEA